MFLCYRNSVSSETSILRAGLDTLGALLPSGWSLAGTVPSRGTDAGVVITAPDGVRGELVVEVKRRVRVGEIPALRARLAAAQASVPLVLAGWLSPLSRRELRDAGISYVDGTGNVDLRLSRPGLHIHTEGAARDPEPAPSALQSLKGPGASRAVRALVDFAPPYGLRELASASGASAPVLSRVLTLLEGEGLVRRGARGRVEEVGWSGVLRRWGEDYEPASAHRAVPYLEPRGLVALQRRLGTLTEPWAATGTLGVPPGTAVAPTHLVTIYVERPERCAQALGLRRVEAGANALLVEPADAGVFARSVRGEDGVIRCAPSQVFVDLQRGPGRGSAEAEALLTWMEADERRWRRLL